MSNDTWRSPMEALLDTDSNGNGGIHVSSPVIGDPVTDAATQDNKQQERPDTCAIRCQKIILDEFEHHDHTETSLVNEAERLSIYTPGHGTQPEDVGKLLAAHGVACHQEVNATAYHLSNELAQGHKVIIGVDSSELWDNPVLHTIKGWLGMTGADHAVLVSGIDTSNPQHTQVIITDPGTGHVASYPIEQFTEAWRASHFFMVATDEPAPISAHGMQNFNYAENHIPDIENLHSEQLENWMDHTPDPYDWTDLPHYPQPVLWTSSWEHPFPASSLSFEHDSHVPSIVSGAGDTYDHPAHHDWHPDDSHGGVDFTHDGSCDSGQVLDTGTPVDDSHHGSDF